MVETTITKNNNNMVTIIMGHQQNICILRIAMRIDWCIFNLIFINIMVSLLRPP